MKYTLKYISNGAMITLKFNSWVAVNNKLLSIGHGKVLFKNKLVAEL